MTTMTCQHLDTRELSTRGFSGSVNDRDQNPAAHGNVTVTEECLACGARRRVNVNQCHVEEGPWGPSLVERQAEVDRLARTLPVAPLPATFRRGLESAEIVCDPDGMLSGSGTRILGLVEQYPGLAAAQARRRAWLELEAARSMV